jgi:hypothetical protein
VTTCQNTLGDSSQVDLNAFGPNVDKNHLKASVDAPWQLHHVQVILAGESRLHSETFFPFEVFFGSTKNLFARRNGGYPCAARTERVCE